MKTGVARFNFYLLALALVLTAGCKTAQERQQNKMASTFRLHLEANPDATQSTAVIDIAGIELYVNNTPFLDETSVTNAAVVDTRDGGYAIRGPKVYAGGTRASGPVPTSSARPASRSASRASGHWSGLQ